MTSSGKLPYIPFYPGDWLKDPKLTMCLPATRGIWIDAIAAMWENNRSGALAGTPGQLARVLRCAESDLMAAVDDLRATGAADVTERNGIVTLVNRRMARQAKERNDNRKRQSRHRSKGGKSPPVTEESHPITSISISPSGIQHENPEAGSPAVAEPTAPPDPPPEPERRPKAERPKDPAYEAWAAAFQEARRVPYQRRNADFVRLAALRKALGVNGGSVPQFWEQAIRNYLASPLTAFTLADLCAKYDVFVAGEIDRYGRPAGHDDAHQRSMGTFRRFTERGLFGDGK